MITILIADDWTAVYKDGERVWNNHSCHLADGLEALGIAFEQREIEVDDLGRTPDGRDPFPPSLPGEQR